MNIDLATINFGPSNGGGDAVIRQLNVTENGTYRAPSGVDGYNPVNVRVAGGGSLTPEEQKALDTLTNASEGVLYAKEYKQYYNVFGDAFERDDWNRKISRMNGDLYVTVNRKIYKFNTDTASFDLFVTTTANMNNYPLWMDKTGRVYGMVNRQIDLETGSYTSVSLDCYGFTYQADPFKTNIWEGRYGVYSLSDGYPQKFNEETQKFETWTINFNNGVPNLANLATYSFEYEGHILFVEYNQMWEIKEYEDHIDVVVVNDPYFPIISIYEEGWHYVSCDAGLFHISNYSFQDNYKFENGSWNSFNIKINDNDNDPYWVSFGGMTVENWWVGRTQQYASSIINLSSDTIAVSNWEDVKNIVVDLKTVQHISAFKYFDAGISVPTISNISQIYASGDLNVNNVTTLRLQAGSIDIQENNTFTKNNIPVVTKDELFTNDTVMPYGNMTETVDMNSIGGLDTNYSSWFNVNDRIFYTINGDWYELTNVGWNQVSFSCEIIPDLIYPAGSGAYMFSPDGMGNMDLYSWDNANTDWVMLSGASRTEEEVMDPVVYFYDGSVFRFANELKLVDLGSNTYEWQQETNVPQYLDGRYVQFNGHIYCNSNNNYFYEYDPATYTYNQLGFIGWPTTGLKVMFGMIVSENYGYLKYVDFNKIDPNEPGIDLNSDDYIIQLSGSSAFFGSNGVNLYCCDANWDFVKTYGVDYEVPEVPAANGTYKLQAVRVGDQITYSWVLDV